MQIQSTTELFDLGVMKLARYQTSDFFLVDSLDDVKEGKNLATDNIVGFFAIGRS